MSSLIIFFSFLLIKANHTREDEFVGEQGGKLQGKEEALHCGFGDVLDDCDTSSHLSDELGLSMKKVEVGLASVLGGEVAFMPTILVTWMAGVQLQPWRIQRLSILLSRITEPMCYLNLVLALRSISVTEMQNAIDERWNLEGRVIVLKKIGKYYIIRAETVSDKDDLIYANSTISLSQVGWSLPPIFDEYDEDGFLIICKCLNFASREIEQCDPSIDVDFNNGGTKLKFKPEVLMGGKHLVHDCGVSQSRGYFLQPLIMLGLFGKRPFSIRLKSITNDSKNPSIDTFQSTTLPILKGFGVLSKGLDLK
ncbi:hypothetical protein Vadar_009951 [Vaccinium darrowii]|uniref:Uncharacterized protein n=1 Tax=Vaccinium darrowii TaxID=229202 RepID=A0ACB7YDW4_9ERIC|nr:hypothetical protein Vadar_009951 [Vaccinium darrowii]